MVEPSENRSHAAFDRLLEALREAADAGLGPEGGGFDEVDVAESYRHLTHLLSAAFDFYLEGDPERPVFTRMVSPTRKFLGDNPDALYHFAPIRGDRAYRVRGRRGEECYFSITVHGRNPDGRVGGTAEPVLSDVNGRSLEFAPDGSFELVLSPNERPGHWVRLAPNAASVITRHYYERPGCPAADPDLRVELRIDPLDDPRTPPPLDDETLARRLATLTAFVRGATIDRPELPVQPPFVSTTPNQLGQPMVFRGSGTAAWGAVDIAYSMGPFRVEPDEALVLTGRFPKCLFANVVLWNRHMQTLDYRYRRASLNRAQTRLEPDGSYRIVLAHRDPGVPNWLDVEGHREGSIFWRFLLPEDEPERPACQLVPLASLAG